MFDYIGWLFILFIAVIGVCLTTIFSLIGPLGIVIGAMWFGWILFWVISAQVFADYRVDLPDLIKRKIEGFTEDRNDTDN